MDIFELCPALLKQGSGFATRLKSLFDTLSRDLGESGAFGAMAVYFSGIYDPSKKRYTYGHDQCLLHFKDRSQLPSQRRALKRLDIIAVEEMARFHNEVVLPLAESFLRSSPVFDVSKRGATQETGPTPDDMIRFRNAFYHYQYACNIFDRYEMVDNTSLKMLPDMLKACSSVEKDDLRIVHDWVMDHCRVLVTNAQKGYKLEPHKRDMVNDDLLVEDLMTRGLDHLQSSLRDGIDMKKLREVDYHYTIIRAKKRNVFKYFLEHAFERQ